MRLSSKLAAALLAVSLLACTSAFRRAMDQGDAFARAGRWDEAAEAYAHAVTQDPEDPEARARLAHARGRAAAERVELGKRLLAAGDPVGALTPLHQAMGLDAANAAAREAFAEARGQVLARAYRALEGGQAKASLPLTQAVLTLVPSDAEALDLARRAHRRIADLALARAASRRAAAQPALELLDLGEALVHAPGDAEPRARLGALRAELRGQVTFHVLLGNLDGDPSADDLGGDVDAEDLGKGLDPALALAVLSRPPAEPDRKPGAHGRLFGMRLGGEFRKYAHDRSSARSRRVCDYVCGTDTVPNPAYPRAQADMVAAEQRASAAEAAAQVAAAQITPLTRARDVARGEVDERRRRRDEARQAYSTCQAQPGSPPCDVERRRRDEAERDLSAGESDLSRAEQALSDAERERSSASTEATSARAAAREARARFDQTSPTMQVDRHCTHRYEVETVSVRGDVELSLRGEGLYDTTPVLTQVVSGRFAASDETYPAQRNVCPELARGDALTIASPGDVRRAVVASALDGARAQILAAFAAHRERFVTDAQHAEAQGRADAAADHWVRWALTDGAGARTLADVTPRLARLAGVDPEAVPLALGGR